MSSTSKEVCITGIGLVSCFGEGADKHWDLLGGDTAPKPIISEETVPPYGVHPLPEMDWSLQIPRRGDQRQMENWQRLGTYAAGLALDDANIKENEELCSTMDLVVSAGGGERDIETDESIMRDAMASNDREQLVFLLAHPQLEMEFSHIHNQLKMNPAQRRRPRTDPRPRNRPRLQPLAVANHERGLHTRRQPANVSEPTRTRPRRSRRRHFSM